MSKNLIPEDFGVGERFWYWRGASGRSLIHSIYPVHACPPLPGAVYVVVRREGGERHAEAVGRFPSTIEEWPDGRFHISKHDLGDEIHVHLLARDDRSADEIQRDLCLALEQPVTSRLLPLRRGRKPQLELSAA